METCLEAARLEVCRRLADKELPTSITVPRLVVVDDANGSGWRSGVEEVRRSPMRSGRISIAIGDDSVAGRPFGLREQLEPLAELLDATTRLGQPQPSGFLPNATGVDAILARVVAPLAHEYLARLDDVAIPDLALVRQLAQELEALASAEDISRTSQLVLEGITVPASLGPYRGVSLRPLSGSERGAIAAQHEVGLTDDVSGDREFPVPRRITFFNPTALLSITSTRPVDEPPGPARLPFRVALAFVLAGFELSSLGFLTEFDEPRWASLGTSHTPFPLQERMTVTPRPITKAEFEAAIDLAYKTPDFAAEESTGKGVVLYRVLRGSGVDTGGFLDFAIALEAALLSGAQTELAYRFSLYGALFLADERDAHATFTRLKRIYQIRSKLVHGAIVRPDDRYAAEQDAAELAKAVARRAIERGWPEQSRLDALALGKITAEEKRSPGT